MSIHILTKFSNFNLVQAVFPLWKAGKVEEREEEEVVLNDTLLFGHSKPERKNLHQVPTILSHCSLGWLKHRMGKRALNFKFRTLDFSFLFQIWSRICFAIKMIEDVSSQGSNRKALSLGDMQKVVSNSSSQSELLTILFTISVHQFNG